MQMPTKACPIVLHRARRVQVLAFEHPLAGRQLVKGTIEPGETPAQAAVRELLEESGVRSRAVADLGAWESGYMGQIWSFHLCEAECSLPETWVYRTADDGGHEFRFFWQDLSAEPEGDWHQVYIAALSHLRGTRFSKLFDTDPQRQLAASPQEMMDQSFIR